MENVLQRAMRHQHETLRIAIKPRLIACESTFSRWPRLISDRVYEIYHAKPLPRAANSANTTVIKQGTREVRSRVPKQLSDIGDRRSISLRVEAVESDAAWLME
jgi:hypothetical protein